MPNADDQLEFPSLAFPKDRKALYAWECAAKLTCDVGHIYDLIDEGVIKAIDISGKGNLSDRRCVRIPIEAWDKFIKERTI